MEQIDQVLIDPSLTRLWIESCWPVGEISSEKSIY